MKTVTNMTDSDLRSDSDLQSDSGLQSDSDLQSEYLRLCDTLITAFQRLRVAVADDVPTMQNAWYSEAAYRWRCLSDVQAESERRQADELS